MSQVEIIASSPFGAYAVLMPSRSANRDEIVTSATAHVSAPVWARLLRIGAVLAVVVGLGWVVRLNLRFHRRHQRVG